ncbi:MAG: hypothetical protein R6V19_05295 [Armatimonadota bacterium]
MRRAFIVTLFVAAVMCLIGCGRSMMVKHNRETAFTTMKQLYNDHPWLKNTCSDWVLSLNADEKPTYSDLASFPLGNGTVLGINGLSLPLGTVTNLIGPGYQKQGGFFAACVPGLRIDGEKQHLPRQAVEWVKKAGVVHTTLQNNRVILHLFDWVPDDENILWRLAVAESTGQDDLKNVELIMGTANPVTIEDNRLVATRAGNKLQIGCVGQARAQEDGYIPETGEGDTGINLPVGEDIPHLVCPIGMIDKGTGGGKLFYLFFSEEDENTALEEILPSSDQWLASLKTTRNAYKKWHESGLQVASGESKTDDFIEIQKHIIRVQQAERGGFSPMDKYTYTWVRDSVGPVRFFLQCGYYDEVKKYLQYQYLGNAAAKEIRLNLALEVNIDSVDIPDWSEIPVERAEVPSYIVLQHYWYYRATGDTELIQNHWEYLKRCIDGQQVSGRGTLPFHSDETYRFPGYEAFRQGREVDSYVQLECQSADSAFEYVAAAEAMAEMAGRLGRDDEGGDFRTKADFVRNATEKYYWMTGPGREYYAPAMSDFTTERSRYPFASINMRPMWIGYADYDLQQRSNVFNSLKYLWQEDGTVWPAPEFGYYTTMVPGFVLYNLSEVESLLVSSALDQLWEAAEESGGFAEMNTPDNRPAKEIWGKHRCRPWEGGINAHAVVHALMRPDYDAHNNRISVAPRNLASQPSYGAHNIPVGDGVLSVTVVEGNGRAVYDFTASGTDNPPKLDVSLRIPSSNIISVEGPFAQQGGTIARQYERDHFTYVEITGVQLVNEKNVPIEVNFEEQHVTPAMHRPMDNFVYGPPEVAEEADTLLLTWNPGIYAKYRDELGAKMMAFDTKIDWPVIYLRQALIPEPGRRGFDRVILDIASYNGAFKRKGFWEEGRGGQLLDEFRALGGTVEMSKYESKLPPSYRKLPRESD